jgi:uncharacterized membrane protein
MMGRAILMIFYLVTSLAVFFVPDMVRREILFGVVVPDGFRASAEGRNALRTFRIAIAICAGGGLLAIALAGGRWLPVAAVAGPLGTAAVMIVSFVHLNRKLKRFAVPLSPVRQMELIAEPDGLPWFVWLDLIPVVLIPAVAVYLNMHWDSIPIRFPVHWGIDGQPNRWANRSLRGVFGPLVFGGELTLWLFALSVAGWYGTRRSEPLRKPTVVLLVVVELFLAMVFSRVALLPLTGFKGVLLALWGLPLILVAAAYFIKKAGESRVTLDPTPAECWKGGMIYYNPNDAALFVGRRDGVGLTANLANPWSWFLAGGLPVLLASGFLLLR